MSHASAGGRLPGAGPLALILATLTVLGSVFFGGRRRRFDVTVLALAGTQFSLHLGFHRFSMPEVGHAAHHMAGRHMVMGPADMAERGIGHSLSSAMTSAHTVATVGTALCVIYGERVLRGLAALVVPAFCYREPPALPVTPQLRPVPLSSAHPRFGVLLARSRTRRGPPSATPA
ncbi:hypothetical protein [Streptomyces sp. NBC_00887]|uniref:hypothetical protein n=1 Tax=Streptomyces sp. NBC_00887 TaxID=2975859 RepID=UPI00386922D3|nr:hypothetical protein OG844_03885 [Streptomyces sp. NBC_00887]WSY35766.1 hypothetical protein OG844_41715 [Streptomyces sp. NBC_00887]